MCQGRRCEDVTNKCIAYKEVVSRTLNSSVRRITNKCDFQKGADNNNERIVIVVIIFVYVK